MRYRCLFVSFAVLLTACNSVPEVQNATSVSVKTNDGLYKVQDDFGSRNMKVSTSIGMGAEINVSRAADEYLSQYRPGCRPTDKISLGAGYIQGVYLVTYSCPS